ncbi:hypothetical protein HMN09_00213600 [Mycena chlorophos]|uniref:Uncharacterized protein n=1 Tax=Mycena chlorophos TaxID=658473 RepID=A0A8H6TLK1_MYCCL|nr:hypothetical protein HMN09_00213600 [Mycena chlorophos]
MVAAGEEGATTTASDSSSPWPIKHRPSLPLPASRGCPSIARPSCPRWRLADERGVLKSQSRRRTECVCKWRDERVMPQKQQEGVRRRAAWPGAPDNTAISRTPTLETAVGTRMTGGDWVYGSGEWDATLGLVTQGLIDYMRRSRRRCQIPSISRSAAHPSPLRLARSSAVAVLQLWWWTAYHWHAKRRAERSSVGWTEGCWLPTSFPRSLSTLSSSSRLRILVFELLPCSLTYSHSSSSPS